MSKEIDDFNRRYGDRKSKKKPLEPAADKEDKKEPKKDKKEVIKDFSKLESLINTEELEGDKAMADEETHEKEEKTPVADETLLPIPEGEAWNSFIGTKDLKSMPVAEANALIKKYEEWSKLQQEIEAAEKAIAEEKAADKKKALEIEKEEKAAAAKAIKDEVDGKKTEDAEKVILEERDDGKKRSPDDKWVQDLETHWKGWCENKDRGYLYERDESQSGLAFKYYKSVSDKAAGVHAVEVHYESPEIVKIKTSDGKAADYEFWKNFALGAKKEQQVVNFTKMAKEENRAKLYIACIANGVDVKSVDEATLSFEDAFKDSSLKAEDRKIVMEKLGLDEYGKKIGAKKEGISFEDWKAKIQKAQEEHGKEVAVDVGTVPEEDRAKAFVAAKLLGAKPNGVDTDKLDLVPVFTEMTKEDQENPAVRALALRAMVQNKEKTGHYKEEKSETDKIAAKKEQARRILEGTRDLKDKETDGKTDAEKKDIETAKKRYDFAHKALVDHAAKKTR
ncbi:MAG: hypothetical protein LBR70_05770 [Lactobacillaceae bacterium]|jgi:hypothetical protein|nr:hypothetical protein [Lactobacillaceae bacterium]